MEIEKDYLCIILGEMREPEGMLENWIVKNEAFPTRRMLLWTCEWIRPPLFLHTMSSMNIPKKR